MGSKAPLIYLYFKLSVYIHTTLASMAFFEIIIATGMASTSLPEKHVKEREQHGDFPPGKNYTREKRHVFVL